MKLIQQYISDNQNNYNKILKTITGGLNKQKTHANFIDWAAHILLHKPKGKSRFKFHWKHHKISRANKNHDSDYKTKIFHNVINIKCNEHNIKFKINGIETKFTIKLDLDDVNEYVIVENLTFDEKYDLNMFNTISSFSKLSNVVALELDTNNPMIIHYKITPENDGDAENDENDENDKFILTFYLVAKTNNDDDINSDQASDNNSDVDENDYH